MSAIYLMERIKPTDVLDQVAREHLQADAEELLDIVAILLDARDEPTLTDCASSVVAQALYYLHAKALVERLHPHLPPPDEQLEALIEHVAEFSLGGLERIRAQLIATS